MCVKKSLRRIANLNLWKCGATAICHFVELLTDDCAAAAAGLNSRSSVTAISAKS